MMSIEISMTDHVHGLLARVNDGDADARDQLLRTTCDRLISLTRKIKRDFPDVGRWDQTDDVFQEAAMRLYRALDTVNVTDVTHYFRLAALQIRRQLIDLARHYHGPQGHGANHHSAPPNHDDKKPRHDPIDLASAATNDPVRLAEWGEFHQLIDQLPDAEKEIFDLLWYHDLPQQEAAQLLNIDVRTVKRRWRSAKLKLHDHLHRDGD